MVLLVKMELQALLVLLAKTEKEDHKEQLNMTAQTAVMVLMA